MLNTIKRRHSHRLSSISGSVNAHIHHPISFDYDPAEDDPKLYKPKNSNNLSKTIVLLKDKKDSLLILLLSLLAFWSRFRQIDRSNIVVWDEAHFGKFGAHYLKHEYYTDVHPPLGKLLVAASGWLANFDGEFDFESGEKYPENVNFQTMRLFNAWWGALLIPLAYLTAQQARMSRLGRFMAAGMVLCDTAYLTISRFILLDSMLLFFTALTCLSLFGFHNQQTQPFTVRWWTWLSLIGVSLGCVLSVKWVGLFAFAMVGVYTVEDLWIKLGDIKLKKRIYGLHWIGRVFCLLGIPALVYITCFKIHFEVLYKSGTGDSDMPSLFQAHLEGNILGEDAIELAFGSNVTIRSIALDHLLLHSHEHFYPEGSKQYQISGYFHRDENSHWLVHVPNSIYDSINNINDSNSNDYDNKGNRLIHHGDTIRLEHLATGANLRTSHQFAAPITQNRHRALEVSGGVGDIKDNWVIEVVHRLDSYTGPRIRSLATQFRLRHATLGCVLGFTGNRLPDWGFHQGEIGCLKYAENDANVNDRTLWVIETNQHDNLPSAPKNTYKYNFLRDFLYLNKMMWKGNNGLRPDPDKEDILSSTPTQWPLVGVGLRMCGWDDDTIKFYLLGNPMVWWPSFLSVVVLLVLQFYYLVRERRQIQDQAQERWNRRSYVGKLLLTGWFLHYMPFYIMGRVLYVHHYFPSLFFSILLVPFLFDHFTFGLSATKQFVASFIFMLLVVTNFVFFAPFSYGMDGPIDAYRGRQWLKWWNLTDN